MVDHHTEAAITIAQQEERIASLERQLAEERAKSVRVIALWEESASGHECNLRKARSLWSDA